MALPAVMLLLAVAMLLGAAAMRSAQQQGRMARRARDHALAFYAAEAALRDAERDIRHGMRAHLFGNPGIMPPFTPDMCHRHGERHGLCQGAPGAGPIWLTAGVDDASPLSASVPFGTFTGRHWPGTAPVEAPAPRYVIEALPDVAANGNVMPGLPVIRYLYRITAVGFGVSYKTAVYLQAVYRKPAMTGEDAGAHRLPSGRLSWREITTWQEMRADLETVTK